MLRESFECARGVDTRRVSVHVIMEPRARVVIEDALSCFFSSNNPRQAALSQHQCHEVGSKLVPSRGTDRYFYCGEWLSQGLFECIGGDRGVDSGLRASRESPKPVWSDSYRLLRNRVKGNQGKCGDVSVAGRFTACWSGP